MDLSGWPEVFKFFAKEYRMPRSEVITLPLIPMCIYLGAITPDHRILQLPGKDYLRLIGTPENRANLKQFHGR